MARANRLPPTLPIVIGVCFLLLLAASRCYKTVEAGYVSVATLFGNVRSEPYTEGLHFPVNPFYKWHDYDARKKTHKEVANVPSQDQLQTKLEVSVQYRLIATETPRILATTGLATDVVNVHLIPKLRSLVREQGKSIRRAEDFFMEETQERLQADLTTGMDEFMRPKGVEVEDVLIRDIQLPPFITKAIEQKKEREQEVEKQKAELERFRTEQQQKIALAEAERVASEQQAERRRILADAQAYEIRKINEAVAQNPAYIQLQALQALEQISKDPASKMYFMDGDAAMPLPLMHMGDRPDGAGGRMSIAYTLRVQDAPGHRFGVVIDIASPEPAGQELMLPAWIPGSYLVRDFARFVGTVSASDERGDVPVNKVSKHTWRCAPARGVLRIEYEVYAWDQSVRGAHLDDTHGFCNGANVFLAVTGQENAPVHVTLERPAGAQADWQVATTLPRADAKPRGFGLYRAADYDELIDHPIEMGQFDEVTCDVAGVPHRVILSGRHHADRDRLARDVARICSEHVALFGELPPMPEYLFLTRVLHNGYGGLEHRSSSALVCSRDQLPGVDATTNKRYQGFLGLVSHEYFHLWNVKRIKPAAFTPYRLDRESYTRQLWIFEGITSYYDDLALVRSGAISVADYLRLLGETITRALGVPGHRWQTLAESSFDAWIKFYKPTPDSANSVVSYYAKGALAALALDLTLRDRTAGKVSLDDVMRAMWQRYGKPGLGVPEDGFEMVCEDVSGLELTPFFDRVIRSTQPLELTDLLDTCGVSVAATRGDGPPVAMGVVFEPDTTRLRQVMRDGAAERAGLAPGDELVAIDGLKVQSTKPADVLSAYAPDTSVTVSFFRDDELQQRDVSLSAAPKATWQVQLAKDANARQLERRAHWLKRES